MKHLLYFAIALIIVSCGSDDKNKTTISTQTKKVKVKFAGINNNDQYIMGQDMNIQVQVLDLESIINLKIYFNDFVIYNGKPEKDQVFATVKTDTVTVGFNNIKLVAEFEGEAKAVVDNRSIVLFSNISPELLLAKVVKKYPHETSSYTQGLEFDGNQLWEGIGQRGYSKLLKVDLNSGKSLSSADLDAGIFGEGITILGDKIYQITWQAGRCYVYDKNTLEKINEFSYAGEGWGITNNGENLIMTDGSSKIYFRNPDSFEITKIIYVFDHSKEWPFLNELEWVEGKIYANVYQKSDIIVIDPKSGKVEQVIDAYDADREAKIGNPNSDVLNGIAYNKNTKELFITGKNYPYLLKIEVVKE